MKKLISTSLAILAFAISLFCQENSNEFNIKNGLILKISPLSIANVNLPSFRLGVEYYPTNWSSIEIDYSQKIILPLDDGVAYSVAAGGNGFRMSGELKIFPFRVRKLFLSDVSATQKNNNSLRYYTALEYYYYENYYPDVFKYQVSEFDSTKISDHYKVQIYVTGVHFKLGYIQNLGSRFLIDAFCGFGFETQIAHNFDLEYNPENGNIDPTFYEWIGGPPDDWYKDRTKHSKFKLVLGIKLCYRIF